MCDAWCVMRGAWCVTGNFTDHAARTTYRGSRTRLHASFPQGEPLSQARRKTSRHDFRLGRRNIVIQTAQFDRSFVHIVDRIGGLGIAVPRLPDAADVDEVFAAGLDLEFRIGAA